MQPPKCLCIITGKNGLFDLSLPVVARLETSCILMGSIIMDPLIGVVVHVFKPIFGITNKYY